MGEAIFEYLKSNYFMLFYLIALVLSLKKYPLYYTSILKFLPVLIGYTFLTELLGFFIMEFDSIQIVSIEAYSHANNLIYNIYDIVFFLYFFYVYWNILRSSRHKNWIKISAVVYLFTAIVNPFWQDFTVFPQMYASAVGSLLLVIFIVSYFGEIKQNKQKNNELLVWISIGLIIFHCFFPVILFTGMLDYELYQFLHLRKLHHLLIVGQYICFIIGFIRVGQPLRKN